MKNLQVPITAQLDKMIDELRELFEPKPSKKELVVYLIKKATEQELSERKKSEQHD